MELLLKAAAAMLLAALIGLLIRKNSPELAMLLSIAAVTAVMLASIRFASDFRELARAAGNLLKGLDEMTAPILKCVAVALITKLSSELCKDAAQSAASSALEFMGTVCALSIAMPLIISVVKTIGGLL